jgi:flagellar biosynthesis/type III secretory pathway protein FliH
MTTRRPAKPRTKELATQREAARREVIEADLAAEYARGKSNGLSQGRSEAKSEFHPER